MLNLTPEQQAALVDALSKVPLHVLLEISAIEVNEDRCVFEMPRKANAFNPGGNFHGGAIATLIDVAAGSVAALGSPAFEPGVNTLVTSDMHVRYLGRATGRAVRAEGRILRAGKQQTIVECLVTDTDTGKLIAAADFASMVVPLRQPASPEGDANSPDL